MKTVLIVDDEKSFLLSLDAGLRQYGQSFGIVTAADGKAAVDVLQRTPVDLVVTDLNMPVMDGFELLAFLAKHHPRLPVIVMTAYATPAIKSSLGPLRIEEKPIDFKKLAESILATFSSMERSYLKGITLPTFLQLVEAERKTCTLKVTSNGMNGLLCVRDGQLLDATTGTERGERAAYSILAWDDVAIEISGVCKVTENRIGKSVTHLVMEGIRLKDERTRAEAPQGGKPPANVARLHAVPPSDAPNPPRAPAGAAASKEDKMGSIRAILTEFTRLQGVTAVCLVGRDGFLLDSLANRGIDTEMVGAIASNCYGASESMGKQLGKGAMALSMSEFERGPVMFSPVGEDSLLVIIAEKDANLGMIRMKLKKEVLALATATAA